MSKNNTLNTIDLFAGCGGLSKGFLDAGFNVLLGVDNNDAALRTFSYNHHNAKTLNGDLSKIETLDTIKELIDNKPVELIIAGPPCQGFSVTGPRKFDDPRNRLYLAVFDAVKYFNPKAFIIENVTGMESLYNGQIKEEIIKRFTALGYNVSSKVLCAADYGVPQVRRRLIFVGLRSEYGKFSYPQPILNRNQYITCSEAIGDLPSLCNELGMEKSSYSQAPFTKYQKLMRGNCSVLYNHVGTDHKQFVKDTIALVPDGGNYKDLPEGVGTSRTFHVAWTRYNSKKPSNTIDTGHRNHFHYKWNRVPTVRENARLQSFPDDFVFFGTKTEQNRQVGNAVPPLLGYHLALEIKKYIDKKITTLDLFAGCGGLMEGFESSGLFTTEACVEWEKAPCKNLIKHLKEKWKYEDADKRVLRFDIQRTKELFDGWNDSNFGISEGLNSILGKKKIDVIIGGPPCQAYSIAGRVRDENGMRDDYRNFLFESYIEVVRRLSPKLFVFENVPGILTAKPTGKPIIDIIKKAFNDCGYEIIDDLKDAIIDFSEYGVPQNRKRIIIVGLNKSVYKEDCQLILKRFYSEILPKYKTDKKTVREAIGDLPRLFPLNDINCSKSHVSHYSTADVVDSHEPRFHSKRDIEIFKLLTEDLESGENRYTSTDALKVLYTEKTGKTSNVHKYYVIRWDEQSNLIPAHLYKDGLRHIHPDSEQSRTITVREAARLQGFPDDYCFVGTQADKYKMIGNAVPPIFSEKLAYAVRDILI